ncbi:Ada metal-binding domain-containing protein [Shinella sp. M31]|uniref:Ada metal-binding domain-containing protein n=1 Tax=Shinella sp. M31 TaxID=3368615 RepID=UPI003BA1DDD9
MDRVDDDRLWAALTARDARQAGIYVVASSGIYCRFGCPSRPPLRKNVRFYATSARASEAGYRACKRCKPGQPAA